MGRSRAAIAARARRVKMVLLDVDGVLTDGGLYYTAEGHELKRFHAHDGYGIQRGREAGLAFGIISGRSTPIVDARARVLKIDDVIQGTEDKVAAMRTIQRRRGFADGEFAFIGDDLFDIPLLKTVGLSAAPPNALDDVRAVVHYVTRSAGGEGAVRDFIDLILRFRRA
ncbi:MAG TPA: HAD-IIIA family hydrolase [Bacteroidota bacterium]|nr:HAD-IIIA family hydrolase [Bacteroidota bacterium]